MKLTKLSERGQELVLYGIVLAVVLLAVWALGAALSTPNRITDERALTRIADMQDVEVSDIQVLYKTNNSVWTGDSYDVSYDIEVKESRKTARCTVTGWWSDMVCRVYTGDE